MQYLGYPAGPGQARHKAKKKPRRLASTNSRSHGLSGAWRPLLDCMGSNPSSLLISRGLSPLAVLIPASATNLQPGDDLLGVLPLGHVDAPLVSAGIGPPEDSEAEASLQHQPPMAPAHQSQAELQEQPQQPSAVQPAHHSLSEQEPQESEQPHPRLRRRQLEEAVSRTQPRLARLGDCMASQAAGRTASGGCLAGASLAVRLLGSPRDGKVGGSMSKLSGDASASTRAHWPGQRPWDHVSAKEVGQAVPAEDSDGDGQLSRSLGRMQLDGVGAPLHMQVCAWDASDGSNSHEE
ncbi:hypothetical protein N2152v2_009516 [Parachlorella kessleri]